MGNICMAVLGGIAGAGVILATAGEAGFDPVQIAAAYLAGGLSAMALFIFASTFQDHT